MSQTYSVNQSARDPVLLRTPVHNFQEDRVKQEFSIKDLENLSGVKAHTIRVWEQRYSLLSPTRSATNIRTYSGNDLKKLLNVALLLDRGLKISKLAAMAPAQILEAVQGGPSAHDEGGEPLAKQRLKVAMMTYDEALFRKTLDECSDRLGFATTVLNVCLPFLAEVGVLWLTDSICPAHEHFMSNLLRQMLFAQVHKAQVPETTDEHEVFVLYLPEREIHDISLLFVHQLCREHGLRSIFLGQSVPFDDLVAVASQFEKVCFVSYCTTYPAEGHAQEYVDRIGRTFDASAVRFCLGGGVFAGVEGQPNVSVSTHGGGLMQDVFR